MRFPESLLKELRENFAVDGEAFLAAHEKPAPVSVRFNPQKPGCGYEVADAVPWSAKAYYLTERPVFTADPLFHAGCYYVQEASSMFVEQAVRQTVDLEKKLVALDACAAPGGKSTLLAALLSKESILVSNEVIGTRVPVLVHNMAKWGHANAVVTNSDPRELARLPKFFDLIVVDAPCSGSGLFRKQEDAVEHWSEENVHHCSLRQQRILADLLPSLKESGVLVYSTCSYSAEENEKVCDQLVSEFGLQPLQLTVEPGWGIMESKSGKGAYNYRFFPHLLKGEGFFLACFRNPGTGSQTPRPKNKKYLAEPSALEQKQLQALILADSLDFFKHNDEIIAMNRNAIEEVHAVAASMKVKKWPLHVGQYKGKDFIPHPHLAYAAGLSKIVNVAELDQADAMKFLRKQPFEIQDQPRDFILIKYKGHGLGWVKNLGNRVNNYYPAEWRILKEEF